VNFRKYRSKIANEDTVMFCLRVMVGVIILYDHVHPVGAFAKSSPIDVRSSYYYFILLLLVSVNFIISHTEIKVFMQPLEINEY